MYIAHKTDASCICGIKVSWRQRGKLGKNVWKVLKGALKQKRLKDTGPGPGSTGQPRPHNFFLPEVSMKSVIGVENHWFLAMPRPGKQGQNSLEQLSLGEHILLGEFLSS